MEISKCKEGDKLYLPLARIKADDAGYCTMLKIEVKEYIVTGVERTHIHIDQDPGLIYFKDDIEFFDSKEKAIESKIADVNFILNKQPDYTKELFND
jgi:hypothetical protein